MEKLSSNTIYRIVNKIAEGGMGAVYKAQKIGAEGFEKTVAIKTLLECYSKDRKFIDKFVSEAKLVANLVHENIVQIYQLDRHKGEYFFVLEFVNGISLYSFMDFLVKAKIQLPEKLAVFIASRIARGLAYAHSRCDANGEPLSIVHCDVCPHNIMITTEGLPKLTDFGIAKAKTMSNDDSVAGKLPFMSPEQAKGRDLDFRSDIYSLGTVLFFMLAGRNSRRTDIGVKEILKEAQANTIHWELMPDSIDEELLEIIANMLATKPDDRYQDTSELARSLEYHIYKDGYGPTIVTLSEYMREQMPVLFDSSFGYSQDDLTQVDIPEEDRTQVMIPEEDKTQVILTESSSTQRMRGMPPRNTKPNTMVYFPGADKMGKTMVLPENFFEQENKPSEEKSGQTQRSVNAAKKTAKTLLITELQQKASMHDKTEIMERKTEILKHDKTDKIDPKSTE
jgi:eukaryotic-like serine/threonine-protein kinase